VFEEELAAVIPAEEEIRVEEPVKSGVSQKKVDQVSCILRGPVVLWSGE
jgi:hypothetical protein